METKSRAIVLMIDDMKAQHARHEAIFTEAKAKQDVKVYGAEWASMTRLGNAIFALSKVQLGDIDDLTTR